MLSSAGDTAEVENHRCEVCTRPSGQGTVLRKQPHTLGAWQPRIFYGNDETLIHGSHDGLEVAADSVLHRTNRAQLQDRWEEAASSCARRDIYIKTPRITSRVGLGVTRRP